MTIFDRTKKSQAHDLVSIARIDRADHQNTLSSNPAAPEWKFTGNQASQRFAQSCPERLPSPGACPFGGVCRTCPAQVQTKLMISQSGDKYEQEAGRVANQIMRMPEPQRPYKTPAFVQNQNIRPQRGCLGGEEELEQEEKEFTQLKPLTGQNTFLIQRQADPEEEEILQAKEAPVNTPQTTAELASQINSELGKGQPLPESVRAFFEPRFGYDFSQVGIHTDPLSAASALAANARAFTTGRDIFFSRGEYSPNSSNGRELLAHELTHVIQQSENTDIAHGRIQRDRRNISGPYQGVATYERVDRRQRTDRLGTIHYGIVVYIPSRISETGVNVDTAMSCIYGSLRLELVTEEWDRARDLMSRNMTLRSSIARLLRIQSDREEISIHIDYDRQSAEEHYRVSAIRLADVLIDFPHPTEEEVWGPESYVCGPDIENSLRAAIVDARNTFRSGQVHQQGSEVRGADPVTDIGRFRACQSVRGRDRGGSVEAATGWDVYDLYLPHTDWLHEPPYRLRCGIPTWGQPGTSSVERSFCGNSVRIGDSCYLAGTVNYALYGEMFRLCSDYFGERLPEFGGIAEMRHRIYTWKIADGDDPVPPTLWAEAGYNRSIPPTNPAAENRAHCSGRCPEGCNRQFRWYWVPIYSWDPYVFYDPTAEEEEFMEE